MKMRGRKQAREDSTSQEQPPGDFLDPTRVIGSDNKEDNPPPATSSGHRGSSKHSRPSSNGTAPASSDSPPADSTTSLRSDNADALPAPPEPLPAQTQGRTTRSQNKFRRPALDVGLDWQSAKHEREAAEAAKTQKKAEQVLKDTDKLEHSHRRQVSLARIAALEDERERRDREEDTTASIARWRGDLALSNLAGGTREPSPAAEEVESNDDGSQVSVNNAESSGSSGDEHHQNGGKVARQSAGILGPVATG
ncbi:hypothetical protein LXA43DRAFT_1063749 [Ganoderma leucocontextum]|nr:hypothetical protein LXA43DRAFT_1063749 [Ganoderma leucocontextum]